MGQRIALHIFHRNRLFRDCLSSVLRGSFDVTSHDCPQDLSGMTQQQACVVLVDMQLPEGAAVPLIRDLARSPARPKVVVLVAADDRQAIVNCVAAGACGCVLEESSLEELRAAIDRVMDGETFCSPQLVTSMFQQLAELSRTSITAERASDVNLTPREQQILELLSDRLTNQEIADHLTLSLYTVKNHVHNILEKLEVDDRFDAIEHARRRHLLRSRPRSLAAPS